MDPSIGKHVVFISHRGIEMKRKFANQLYHALEDRGIKTFLDIEELPEGRDVRPYMLAAAGRGIIPVPIFTKDYATSHWCLNELVQMMSSSYAKVIPVFYDVKAEDLRHKNGPFAEAIEAYRKEGKHDEEIIRRWEDALTEASWRSGFWLEDYNQFEGELLKHLVDKIVTEYMDLVEEESDAPVGLEERVKDVVDRFHLQDETTVYFVLLWGMAGIGKTTLARAIYRKLRNKFQAGSRVTNCGDQRQIQVRLLHDLLLYESRPWDDLEKGKERLKNGLREKKVLIVLDVDVKSFASIMEVVDLTYLHRGSRILVTSRDKGVFPPKGELSKIFKGELYEVQPMGDDDSLQLFCRHAFKQPSPKQNFEGLAKLVVQGCAGLPHSLEMLGRRLSGEKKEKQWKAEIDILRSNKLHRDISDKLMSSYETLNDDKYAQEMFLDVACFLIGERKSSAKYFWDSCQVDFPGDCLKRLIGLCLVKVGEDKRLTMHPHLRYLGRGIVKKSGKWSRLWDDDNLLPVLKWEQDLDQIRGIATSLRSLNAALLSRMRSLRLLFLDGTALDGDLQGLQRLEIRWLKWSNCPHQTLPEELLNPVTVLAVGSNSDPCSNLWTTGIQQLSQLREISITTNMVKRPDFIAKMTELAWIQVDSSESGADTIRLKRLKDKKDAGEDKEKNGCTLNADAFSLSLSFNVSLSLS